MGARKPAQRGFALRRQADAHLPAVLAGPHALHQSPLRQPVEQSDHAVMPNQQLLRQLPHGRARGLAARADCQQQLVLLRLQPLGPGRLFAEVQKAPYPKAKLRQRLVIRGGQSGAGNFLAWHGPRQTASGNIVSRYNRARTRRARDPREPAHTRRASAASAHSRAAVPPAHLATSARPRRRDPPRPHPPRPRRRDPPRPHPPRPHRRDPARAPAPARPRRRDPPRPRPPRPHRRDPARAPAPAPRYSDVLVRFLSMANLTRPTMSRTLSLRMSVAR